jgi:hypothetical protein
MIPVPFLFYFSEKKLADFAGPGKSGASAGLQF